MGWPLGWTDFARVGMASSRSKRRMRFLLSQLPLDDGVRETTQTTSRNKVIGRG